MESLVCCAHMLHVIIGYNGKVHVLILATHLCWIFFMQGAVDSLTHVQFSDDSDDSMLFVTIVHTHIASRHMHMVNGACWWDFP